MAGSGVNEIELTAQQTELKMRVQFLERQTDEQERKIEELHALVIKMNETIIELNHTIKSVAEPLNNDIKGLKEFANNFNNLRYKFLGGFFVIAVIFSSLWGLFSPFIQKLISKSIG